jgi:peptidoglycan/LPS O-acetylase OafA/YrhL
VTANYKITRLAAIPALTGVRFLAAIAVLMFHYGATFSDRSGVPFPITQALHNGYLGVSLFFVLSGFILTYTHQCDTINGRFLSDFYVARFARIYPVYLLALLIALPILSAPLSVREALTVLLMLQSWTSPLSEAGYLWVMQAWTLSVEFFFYLFFPLILLCAKRLNVWTTIFVVGVTAILIMVFGLSSIVPGSTDIPYIAASTALPIPIFRTAEFIYGVMLCRLTMFYPGLSQAIGGSLFELILAGMILIILSFATDVHVKALVTVLVGVLIIQLSNGYGPISTGLSSKPLVLLGGASYAIYLLQGPMRSICENLIPHPLDRFSSPVLTILGAIAVFLFWEQPCRRALLFAYRWSIRRGSLKADPKAC